MITKWVRWFIILALLLTPAVLIFLTSSEPGLRGLVSLCNRLSAGRLTINTASGSLFGGSLRLQGVRYADSIDTVAIENVTVIWNPAKLLNKQFQIDHIRISGGQVILGQSAEETIVPPPFSSPIKVLIQEISAEKIAIFSDQEEIALIQAGTISRLTFQGQDLTIDDLSVTTAEAKLQAKGQLRTTEGYPLQLTLEALYQPAGYESFSAKGTINGPLNTLALDVQALTPFPVRLKGQVNNLLGDLTWQARLESEEVGLAQIHKDWPNHRFVEVVIEGRGTLEEYTLHLDSSTELYQLKKTGNISADLQGNLVGLQIDDFHFVHEKTSLAGKGSLEWSPGLSWKAEITGSHLDPSLVFTDWPGDVSFAMQFTGRFIGNDLEASFDLPQLQGTLRNLPLTGKGEVHLKDSQLQIQGVRVTSAGSALQIHGKAAETVDLSLQLDSNNLAELWPNARGSLHAKGRLTGNPAKPTIDFKLTGTNLGQRRDGVGKLTLETRGEASMDGRLDATLIAEQLQFGGTALDQSRVHFQGSLNDHALTVESEGTDLSAGFRLQGKIIDKGWQGTLSRIHLTSLRFGNWQQRQATSFSLSAGAAEIKPLCLTASPSGSLCINGSWSGPSNDWQLHGTFSSLPLGSMQNMLPTFWPVEGPLSGTIDLGGKNMRIVEGKLDCDSSGMTMSVPLENNGEQILRWHKNILQAAYAKNRLQVNLESELTDKSRLRVDLSLADLQLPGPGMMDTPLKGMVQLHVQDLSPLTLLTEQRVQVAGVLQGQFALKGTPAAPMITGQMELTKGQADIPPLGITLSPLTVAIKGDNNRLQFQATAHSGSGILHATSSLNIGQSEFSTFTVMLTGEGFKAAQLPGLDVDLSPELQVIAGKNRIDIHGTVTIPRARIKSIDFTDAIVASNDMIVIDDEQKISSPTAGLPLFTSINVIAGEDVQIDAYGLRGILSGKLQVSGQPDRIPIGNGTLTVQKGSFTMYGKRLKIDLGRLLFTGGPLTNPGIELRSENKSDKMTTGVVVEGFLQHPEISFYSTPPMEQSAIVLNLLENTAIGGETRGDIGFIGKVATKVGLGGMVPYLQSLKKVSMIDEIKFDTGDDFDSMSLIFGSWLTPYFYVSYGKNLTEEAGTFNTRYTLGQGFYFMTETGPSQSGGDLKYEFEH